MSLDRRFLGVLCAAAALCAVSGRSDGSPAPGVDRPSRGAAFSAVQTALDDRQPVAMVPLRECATVRNARRDLLGVAASWREVPGLDAVRITRMQGPDGDWRWCVDYFWKPAAVGPKVPPVAAQTSFGRIVIGRRIVNDVFVGKSLGLGATVVSFSATFAPNTIGRAMVTHPPLLAIVHARWLPPKRALNGTAIVRRDAHGRWIAELSTVVKSDMPMITRS